jgi:cytoplasmic iron level regulating protein YaaA (DUF328/UPF0246 family)
MESTVNTSTLETEAKNLNELTTPELVARRNSIMEAMSALQDEASAVKAILDERRKALEAQLAELKPHRERKAKTEEATEGTDGEQAEDKPKAKRGRPRKGEKDAASAAA